MLRQEFTSQRIRSRPAKYPGDVSKHRVSPRALLPFIVGKDDRLRPSQFRLAASAEHKMRQMRRRPG